MADVKMADNNNTGARFPGASPGNGAVPPVIEDHLLEIGAEPPETGVKLPKTDAGRKGAGQTLSVGTPFAKKGRFLLLLRG